jgi:hypothetical protein
MTQEPVLLTEFHQWMHQQRGTSGGTLQNYSRPIRDLLETVGDPSSFDALKLRQFVLQRSKQSGWGRAKVCTTGVRMFLRFLIAEGKCAVGLDAAFRHWRIGVFRRCRGICNLRRSNALLPRVIVLRRLADGIAPFYFCWHARDFGRVMLSDLVWATSTGSKPGLMFPEKGGVRRGCP